MGVLKYFFRTTDWAIPTVRELKVNINVDNDVDIYIASPNALMNA